MGLKGKFIFQKWNGASRDTLIYVSIHSIYIYIIHLSIKRGRPKKELKPIACLEALYRMEPPLYWWMPWIRCLWLARFSAFPPWFRDPDGTGQTTGSGNRKSVFQSGPCSDSKSLIWTIDYP